jgi:hypothetical protein
MQIEAGSIIQRRLEVPLGPLYNHVGIFVSEDQVIHFNGERKGDRDAVIKIESLDDFAAGYEVKVRANPEDDDHAFAIVLEAQRQYTILENNFDRQYSFFWKNCEDFAVHCYQIKFPSKTDPKKLQQVFAPMTQTKKTIWGTIATAVPTILLVVGIALFRRGDKRS